MSPARGETKSQQHLLESKARLLSALSHDRLDYIPIYFLEVDQNCPLVSIRKRA